MNFLAHLYLSQHHKKIMIGNFIADHVKGKQFDDFEPLIQKGILLHRVIDEFTDNHDIVRKSKQSLHPRYRHYDGVIIDIFYDYFLAKNWANYSAIPLQIFTQSIYALFEEKSESLPIKSQNFIKYMIQYDILYNYQFKEGIQKVLNGMNHRTKGKSQMDLALEDLINLEQSLEEDFTLFFDDLISFSNQKLNELLVISDEVKRN